MIKPPSSQKTFDTFYSGDPAIVSLPEEASDEQRKDHDHRLEVARETANWTEVTIPGEQPTVFTFKPLTSEQTGELVELVRDPRERKFPVFALAFRLALVGVKNLPEAGKIDFVGSQLGKMATLAFLERAGVTGEAGAAIVLELGSYVLERARAVNPKS